MNLPISRRQVLTRALAASLTTPCIPFNIARANNPMELLWIGVTFMRSCPIRSDRCEEMNAYFPNTWPTLASETGNQEKILYVDKTVPKFVRGLTGKNNDIKVVLPTAENNYGDKVDTDLGIFVGIASDRDIAHKYEKEKNVLIQAAELQTYIIVFDIKKYQIIQSYPIRFVKFETFDGRNRKGLVEKLHWQTITGTPPNSDQTALISIQNKKNLPKEFAEVSKKLVINRQNPVGIRVTQVNLMNMAKKWLKSEESARGNTPGDYRDILGHAITSAASEKLDIGIQPFSASDSIMRVTDGMVNKRAKVLDKDFNTGHINWDIRLTAYGTRITDQKVAGYKTIVDRRIFIGVGITVGKYQRYFEGNDPNNPEIMDKQKPVQIIFRQNFSATSVERTSGAWSNNWYYVLDLHQRLFEWFFDNLNKKNFELIFRGQQQNLKTRKFLTKAMAKDFALFERQARSLRKILMG